MSAESDDLTAWGRWVSKQPPGTLSKAMRATGLAWTTVSKAQHRRVELDTAELLSKFSKRAFRAEDIARKRRTRPVRSAA